VETARKEGQSEASLAQVFEFQRKAQWRVDFINAENSMGFHAPQEAARVLGEAIDYSLQGHVALSKLRESANRSNPAPANPAKAAAVGKTAALLRPPGH